MSKWGIKDTIDLLELNVTDEIEAGKAKERAKNKRRKIESLVWHNHLPSNPNLGRPIEELGLGEGATTCVPNGVNTLGELCQHSEKELLSKGAKKIYIHEICDSLRKPFGLVLKPDQ